MYMGSKYYGHIQATGNSNLHLGDIICYGDQERLKHVPGALFNAYGQDHRPCHPDTRRELLEEVELWAEHSADKSIFWLNGMAGTGKSTIAYTVAERLNQRIFPGRATLGASFFFKRGERDRASAALFFPTIARQLRQKIPGLAVHIDQAIDIDPDICSKSLGEQFNRLLEGPLRRLDDSPSSITYVVVVDALDECQEEDVRTLLQLWSRLSQNPPLYIRWFLTSRPELPIQLGFSRVSIDARQDVVLHDMPPSTIKHDISVFLADAFSQIRDEYNFVPPSDIPLPEDWPGATVLEELAEMAVPLFIIAATICRFVQDKDFDPQDQLRVILCSRRAGQISDLGQIYLPILKQVASTTQAQLHYEFRLIVGAIITVAEPFSRLGLSVLLGLPPATVARRLRSLHSVLRVPQLAEEPIRPLHLSFAEFLSSEEIRDQAFWINRAATHAVLLTKCLELLSQPKPIGLSENMCHLSYPGQLRRDLAHTVIHDRLPPAMQYACRYWTYHAQQCGLQICDNSEVHHFLEKYFLRWLESLSLLGHLPDALRHIGTLQSVLATKESVYLAAFLKDARRFIFANRYICDRAPLQLYSSAIVFAPQSSIIKKVCGNVPGWIRQCPLTPWTWNAELQTLEGHTDWVNAVAFSPDGSLLASASGDQTVRLWDAKTGHEMQGLEGHTGSVSAVAFSPDGSLLASASEDWTVRLWDVKTGHEVQRLEGHTDSVEAAAFSPDGSQLASASGDWTIRLWDTKTGHEIQMLEGHTGSVSGVAFSSDDPHLASASEDRTVRLWDTKTGHEMQRLEGHTDSVSAVAFSPDGSLLASASEDWTVRLWDAKTGHEMQRLEGHTRSVYAVAFSPDGSQLASASLDKTVRLWDTKTGHEVRRLEGHTNLVNEVAFSPDGSQLASTSWDKTVRLWDAKTGHEVQRLEGHTDSVNAVAFSPDGSQLASTSRYETVRLWDTKTGHEVQRLEIHTSLVKSVVFSPDGSQLALISVVDETVRLWDTKTGHEVQMLGAHTGHVNSVSFSPDGSQLASASGDKTVRLWDARTGHEMQRLEGHTRSVYAVAFSPDGSRLASASEDWTIRLWDAKTGQQLRALEDKPYVFKINFSSDGRSLLTTRETIYIGATPSISETHIKKTGNNLILNEDWVECGYKRVLWPPHAYRSAVSAVHNNILAIGRPSGLVSFLQITQP